MKSSCAFLALLLSTTLSCAAPSGIDLHEHWDQRCSTCHGHSGDFARRFLRVENGSLLGVHHRKDLDVFLRNHYLNDALVAPVTAMLLAQASTPPLYRDHCAECHGAAADFARKSLEIRDGTLVGASSGRKLADFLTRHGGLAREEVPVVVDSLTRVRQEVSNSGK